MSKMDPKKPDDGLENPPEPDDRPPLGSWRRMYTLVLANLALLIVLFYVFTRSFD